jgi:ATP-binding cassette subfamily G (WHITE) protein 2 (PDR)
MRAHRILIKSADLPRFWIFMYRVSPLTYLTSVMMSAGIANSPIRCADFEMVKLSRPPEKSCAEYLNAYASSTGAQVIDLHEDQCGICPLSSTNAYLDSIGVVYSERWQNFGIFVVFVVFNVAGAFLLYWIARVAKPQKKNTTRGSGSPV